MKKLLLGSGGIRTEERMNAWKDEAKAFLKGIKKVLFIPYANKNYDQYVMRVNEIDFHAGCEAIGIHTYSSAIKAVEEAECISVGGGNSFRLLTEMQRQGIMPLIREKVLAGMPYLGVSAGSNLACPTIKTTNDMPIVCPAGLDGLSLIHFQINPHFFHGPIYYYETDHGLIPYGGETREDRIREFHEMNSIPILGLYEGSILRVIGDEFTLTGAGKARLFRPMQPPKDFELGSKLEIL